MAWYYVKSGGTATGDGGRVTTQRTGAWSGTTSEYYDNLEDANNATTPPTDGDSILCSDLHNASVTFTADVVFNAGGVTGGAGLEIISVDDANQENYKPGAFETQSAAFSYVPDNNCSLFGVTLVKPINDATWNMNIATSRYSRLQDCKISSDTFVVALASDGNYMELINVDLERTSDSLVLVVSLAGGAKFRWRGGKYLGLPDQPLIPGGQNAGHDTLIEGVDLSVLTDSILAAGEGPTAGDVFTARFVNCLLNSSLILPPDSDFDLPQHRFEMWGCDDTDGGELFRFHMQDGTGKVVNNNSKFVTNENVWYGGSPEIRSSYEVSTKALCSHVFPFVFQLPIEYVDLTSVSKIRVLVATTLTLTDTEIAAYLVYPDQTTPVQPNWVTSGKVVSPTGSPERINYGTDPLAAGTELPTSTAVWTDPGSPQLSNKYYLELDTSAAPGAAGPISVRIEIYRASIVAGELYLATEYEKV